MRRWLFRADIKAVKVSSPSWRWASSPWFQPAPHRARTLTSTSICPAGETLSLPVRCAPRKSERLSHAHARPRPGLPHKGYPPALRWHPPEAALPPDGPLPSRLPNSTEKMYFGLYCCPLCPLRSLRHRPVAVDSRRGSTLAQA